MCWSRLQLCLQPAARGAVLHGRDCIARVTGSAQYTRLARMYSVRLLLSSCGPSSVRPKSSSLVPIMTNTAAGALAGDGISPFRSLHSRLSGVSPAGSGQVG